MFKKMLLIVFVSSCGPLKIDNAKAEGLESLDALTIAYAMLKTESCESIYDFLQDTALDHNIDDFQIGCEL